MKDAIDAAIRAGNLCDCAACRPHYEALAAAARAEGRREAETALRRAVNEECDCGGAEYGKGCKACDVWHKARALSAPAATGAPTCTNCGEEMTCAVCDAADAEHAAMAAQEAYEERKRIMGASFCECDDCDRCSWFAATKAAGATTVGEGPAVSSDADLMREALSRRCCGNPLRHQPVCATCPLRNEKCRVDVKGAPCRRLFGHGGNHYGGAGHIETREEYEARVAAAPPTPPKGDERTCGGYMCNFPECPKHGTGTQWNAGRPRPESAEANVCGEPGCDGGTIYVGDEWPGQRMRCSRCGGTGEAK